MADKRDLTSGPTWQKLLQLAGPMVFGIIAVSSVSLIDTYYVGQLGTQQLTALSFTFPVTLTVSSLAIGLGAGASSVVSRAVGSGDKKSAKRLATDSIFLALVLVITVASIGFFSIDPLFSLLGASGEVLDMLARYMRIWFLAIPLLVVPIVANSIVRAVGDTFWPSLVMVGSAIINIALTPLFIYGWGPIPDFGIEGAAMGTMFAWLMTTFGAFVLVAVREKMLVLKLPSSSDLMRSWKRVLAVGVPASLGNAVNPIGIAVVTAVIASFGDVVVAAYGVATRIESFSVIPMLALSAAIGPFSGQNWGAGQCQRVTKALKVSYLTCAAWSAILAAFFYFGGKSIVSVFTEEQEVIMAAATYLLIVPLSLWGYGIVIITAGAFNAIGRSQYGLGLYLMRTAVLYVPFSFIASRLAGSDAVFYGIAAANAVAGLSVGAFALYWLSKHSPSDEH